MQEMSVTELSLEELEDAGGAGATAEWGVATGVAAGLVVGAAAVASPVIAGAFAVGAIYSAGLAIYYALEDENKASS